MVKKCISKKSFAIFTCFSQVFSQQAHQLSPQWYHSHVSDFHLCTFPLNPACFQKEIQILCQFEDNSHRSFWLEKRWKNNDRFEQKNSGLHILRRSNNSKMRKRWGVRTLDTISSFSNLEIASSTSKSHFSLNLVASSCSQRRSRSCFTEVKSVNAQQISPASKAPSPRTKKA